MLMVYSSSFGEYSIIASSAAHNTVLAAGHSLWHTYFTVLNVQYESQLSHCTERKKNDDDVDDDALVHHLDMNDAHGLQQQLW